MTATIALPRTDWLSRLRTIMLRPGQRVVMLPGDGMSVSRRAVSSGAVAWWLEGGISAANAIAAYQPKNAASLAASYVNLANPGTYDAAPGVAPTFNAATGWTFNGSTQYLTTGVVPENNQGWSAIVRWSDLGSSGFLGISASWQAGRAVGFAWNTTTTPDTYYYYNGGVMNAGAVRTVQTGVSAVAGNTAYFDGSVDGTAIPSAAGVNTYDFWIGWNDVGVPYLGGAFKVQAAAIYDTVLTAFQVAALSAAMAAL